MNKFEYKLLYQATHQVPFQSVTMESSNVKEVTDIRSLDTSVCSSKSDKNRAIAIKIKLMSNDLDVVHKAYISSQSEYKELLTKGRLTLSKINKWEKEINESFEFLKKMCNSMQDITDKKTAISYVSSRIKANANLQEKVKKIRNRQSSPDRNRSSKRKQSESSIAMSALIEMNESSKASLGARKSSRSPSPKKAKQSSSSSSSIKNVYPFVEVGETFNEFHMDKDTVYRFSKPNLDTEKQLYSLGELLENLEQYEFNGYQNLVKFMIEKGYIGWSFGYLKKCIPKYKETNCTDDFENDLNTLVPHRGRKAVLTMKEIPQQ